MVFARPGCAAAPFQVPIPDLTATLEKECQVHAADESAAQDVLFLT
jgi:hypothetical protein